MEKYLLGLDNGNTVCKAVLFDTSGKELQIANRKVATHYPEAGFSERNMHELWKATADAIKEVIEKASINAKDILAVGCTGHGNGVYLLDKNKQPLKGIQSLDLRAAAICSEWMAQGISDAAKKYTQQDVWPAQTNALLAWFKKHEPEIYSSIGSVLLCKDYINYCLAGVIASDYTDMSLTNLMDIFTKSYSDDLLRLYQLTDISTALPPLFKSHEIIGSISKQAATQTDLAEGTPVAAGMIDVTASTIGSGIVNTNQLCIIAGTWSVNTLVLDKPIADSQIAMTSLFAAPEKWLAVEASATSVTNLEWFVSQFCYEEKQQATQRGISVYEVCDELIAKIPNDMHLPFYHPYLHGFNINAQARAGFYNISGWHTKADLLKSVYEGIVFSHNDHIIKLKTINAPFNQNRLTGGAIRSKYLSQLFADVLGMEIEIPSGFETGALGAAIAAGAGTGVFTNYSDAVAKTVAVKRVHKPEERKMEYYKNRFAHFKSLQDAMAAPWQLIQYKK